MQYVPLLKRYKILLFQRQKSLSLSFQEFSTTSGLCGDYGVMSSYF